MAEESEPEESTTLPDEEGTDRSTDADSDETPDEPPAADRPSDADEPDGSEDQDDADWTDESERGTDVPTDDTEGDDGEAPETVVDPLGNNGPRPHEWLDEKGDAGTDSAADDSEGNPTDIQDGDAESEDEIIGPVPAEETEPLKPDPYGPDPADDDDDGYMDLYQEQESVVQESLNPEYVEPLEETTIGEPEPGTPLDREGEGPPDDREMPLTEHVEEMVWRLGAVVVTAAVVTILAYPFSEGVTLHVWTEVLPTADAPDPHLYGPLEKVLTQIKVAGLAGILIALPMVVYQTYRFMRPGLYPHERRYYLAAVPTSLVLAALGMAFSYLLVLPTLFVYFMYYTEDSVDIVAFGLSKTFNLIVTLTGVLAIVFQIPLFIMLAIMMGVTSRRWLANKRIYFWAAFAGASFLIAPDPTGMAPFLVAGTAIGLFEGTLFLLKWVKRGRQRYRRGRESGT
ncbi:MAG: twin-arginine translocase subunit TatC [Halobacteriales archaeon]